MQARELRDGGRLEMLKVEGVTNAQLDRGQTPGVTYGVEWVTIDTPDTTFAAGTTNDQASVFVEQPGDRPGAPPPSAASRGSSSTPARSTSSRRRAVTRLRARRLGRRLRRRLRSALGVRHGERDAHAAVRVAQPHGARAAGQPLHQPAEVVAPGARTARPRTTCAASRPRAGSSTSRSTPWSGGWATSSPARRLRPTARCCS